ncbi:hypothetical protein CYLTODRAFT_351201 [Cylindrobasidium torrendii FP15055 ss-10]|uniref:MYND-type domain-containing protein n=1 Tax=Cylindrobasidium torrendii FP15055 ss-10 TaxID=1314674 RepID=A0A0D7BE86_9AGAR|nr:hypothetical protein CYLTODRAFT_351201 [Cylindrobasidium torrendii FP15055 ss-10]
MTTCKVCSAPTFMVCGRGCRVAYCSQEHLNQDWLRHKYTDCVQRSGVPNLTAVNLLNPLNTLPTVLAIFFNPSSEEHTFQRVTIREYNSPDLSAFFPNDTPKALRMTQTVGSSNARFPLHIWFSPRARSAHTPKNRAIAALTQGHERRQWCGPVIVLKLAGRRTRTYRDVTDVDFVTLTQYFIDY